jgi:hypothetical protein
MTLGEIAGISTAGISVLALLYHIFGSAGSTQDFLENLRKENIVNRVTQLETRIGDANLVLLGKDVAKLQSKMEIFFDAMAPALRDIIKQPHPEANRKDELMDRLKDLDVKELCELRDILKKEATEFQVHPKNPTISDSLSLMKSISYGLQIAQINMMLLDKDGGDCK